ncbi:MULTISPECIES: KH domain-containing protein [unclassified Granulicatella]|uniref:KH domain-containing protein n=1 Tax=unclassified Granulicatella TaxID=2630493 RepID=UPI0013D5382F|nr:MULTISPECIES: KH domain-containing protein [unclassified Granulicatella]MBS4750093.1 KH domain-containing protein [Carnobacteriaceae bacterium zg-ZUI78]QMI86259.1 KH domain-containing protein [Carnobacteriaceae bacterium zg-84]
MPNIEDLLLSMVKPLVLHPDELIVRIEETSEFMEYHLVLNQDDIGRVIGRQGRVVQAIRTILYSVRDKGNKRVRLVINDAQENE